MVFLYPRVDSCLGMNLWSMLLCFKLDRVRQIRTTTNTSPFLGVSLLHQHLRKTANAPIQIGN